MKKTLAMLLALILILGLFAGCSNQPDTAGSDPEPEETEVSMLPKDKTYSVLFIGNSQTFYNDMPETIFEPLAESCGYDVEVTSITQGNWKIAWFADPEDVMGAKVAEALDGSKHFDFVTLQGHGLQTCVDPAPFYDGVRKLADKIRSIGAQPVLYCTMSRATGHYELAKYGLTNESMSWTAAGVYTAIGEELDIPVVYAGLAMYDLHNNTGVDVYDPDGVHPSATGSHVIALTLFSGIFGVDPTTVTLPDYLSEWDVQQIQEAVKKVVFDTPEIPEEYRTTSEGVTAQEG